MHLRETNGTFIKFDEITPDEIAADHHPQMLQAIVDAQSALNVAHAVNDEAHIDVETTKRIHDHYVRLYGDKFRVTFMDEWRAFRTPGGDGQ